MYIINFSSIDFSLHRRKLFRLFLCSPSRLRWRKLFSFRQRYLVRAAEFLLSLQQHKQAKKHRVTKCDTEKSGKNYFYLLADFFFIISFNWSCCMIAIVLLFFFFRVWNGARPPLVQAMNCEICCILIRGDPIHLKKGFDRYDHRKSPDCYWRVWMGSLRVISWRSRWKSISQMSHTHDNHVPCNHQLTVGFGPSWKRPSHPPISVWLETRKKTHPRFFFYKTKSCDFFQSEEKNITIRKNKTE
jgi:hypothetical protein